MSASTPLDVPAGIALLLPALLYAAALLRMARAITATGRVASAPAPSGGEEERPFVSVVLAARNEEEHLPGTLRALLDQDYPPRRYEIVVVDDRSTDGTAQVVARFAEGNPGRVRLLSIAHTPDGWAPKMWAMQQGVEAATGTYVLTTDADCLVGNHWIALLSGRLSALPAPGMVGGPVDYIGAQRWRWPRRLLRTEFVALSLAAAGSIASGHPLLISSQNLGFSRSLFRRIGGHTPHRGMPSGDDVFLLYAASAAGAPISYLLDADAAVLTHPPRGPADFYQQRARWASKGSRYPAMQLRFSLLVWALNALLLLAGAGVLGGWRALLPWLAGALALKVAGDLSLLRQGRRVGLHGAAADYLTGLPLHIPYVVIAGLGGVLRLFRWK